MIKMHDNNHVFPILLGKPWLRMANAIVDWEGLKPSITYGLKDNRVKVSIWSLGGWVREEVDPTSDDKENGKDEERFDDTLVGVVQLDSEKSKMYSSSGFLGPSFYNQEDSGKFAHWLRQYPISIGDVIMMSHRDILRDDISRLKRENYLSLKPCHGGRMNTKQIHWIDDDEDCDVSLVHVGGNQDNDAMLELSKLEEPLHFKTTSTRIIVGHDVRDYPNVPPDWYRNIEDHTCDRGRLEVY